MSTKKGSKKPADEVVLVPVVVFEADFEPKPEIRKAILGMGTIDTRTPPEVLKHAQKYLH